MKRWLFLASAAVACAAIYFFFYGDVSTIKSSAVNSAHKEMAVSDARMAAKSSSRKQKSIDELNYETTRDLSLIADDIKSKAEAGDAIAARTYAKMLEECWRYSMASKDFKAEMDALSKIGTPYVDIYKNVGSVVEKRCKNFSLGQPISMEEVDLWYAQAMLSRDGQAIARFMSSKMVTHPLNDQAMKEGVDMIIASRDPDALLDLASLMGSYNQSRSSVLGPYSGSDLYENAWRIAACRLGANCSSRNPLLVNYCLNGARSACMGYNLQETIRRDVLSPSEYEAAWNASTQIINNLPHP